MKFLCYFKQCNWIHIINVRKPDIYSELVRDTGLYQCSRCKTISVGAYQKK
ncbi:MAG: hypothetical protein GQ540_03410 [Lutibacter sp.]|uniref:hypothetical protein n=1 Tax=Lutibacter sp. TaxID=1925666 RepID=UPI0019F4B0EF|nr:hypothetical protein [Lutibacter sp.]NOR27560.1 hypothetical protein [Lutibacter sp.]